MCIRDRWYDVTNSAYVGTKGIITPGLNNSEGRCGDIVGDEAARYVTDQADTFELRLLYTSGNLTDVETPSGLLTNYPYVSARCLIWRYST